MVEFDTPPLQREEAMHGIIPGEEDEISTLFKIKVCSMNGSFIVCHLLTHYY